MIHQILSSADTVLQCKPGSSETWKTITMSFAISFDAGVTPVLPIHRFSVDQYHRLGEVGVLTPEDRVELLEGWIVQKMNHRPVHGFVIRLINEWLQRELPDGWLCQCQLPITTARSEPEPDIAVIKGRHQDFRDRHPGGSDCRLLIEVADTSVHRDREKAAIYRDAGVAEYWIINLAEKQLERYQFSCDEIESQPIVIATNETVTTNIDKKSLTLELGPLFG